MSVKIRTDGNITTISHLGWDIPVHLKDGKFLCFGVPKYSSNLTYVVTMGIYEGTSSFAHPYEKSINGMPCPAINIGKFNDDGSFGKYACVIIVENGFDIFDDLFSDYKNRKKVTNI